MSQTRSKTLCLIGIAEVYTSILLCGTRDDALPSPHPCFSALFFYIDMVEIYWVVTLYSVMDGFGRFGGKYSVHLQG
jgi:hypothetical protein